MSRVPNQHFQNAQGLNAEWQAFHGSALSDGENWGGYVLPESPICPHLPAALFSAAGTFHRADAHRDKSVIFLAGQLRTICTANIAFSSRQPVGSQGLVKVQEVTPSSTFSQRKSPASTSAPQRAGLHKSSAASVPSQTPQDHVTPAAQFAWLTYDESVQVAEYMHRVWVGMTGCKDVPSLETVTDMVRSFNRKSREVVAQREERGE